MKQLILITALFLLLSACSKPELVEPIKISTIPVGRPELVLPTVDPVRAREVQWTIITESNYDEVFAKLKASGKDLAIFGLTADGYENLALNANDLRTYIQQQNSVVTAYRNYYIRSQSAFEGAVIVK